MCVSEEEIGRRSCVPMCMMWLFAVTPGLRSQSRKESEVFGWSRIPNNTESWSRSFCPTPDVQLDHFLHTLQNLEFLLKWYNFF